MTETSDCIVIGAGPAGLTAAYELARRGLKPIVLEADGIVGGIARTEVYRGFRFDMGGHRFFTKSAEVNRLWREFLGPEFLKRPRLSRIFYNDRFFSYPLKPFEVVRRLGIVESLRCGFSYLKRSLRPHRPEVAFSDWVSNRFGDRLFEIFFKSYTEKIWGIPTSELSADWAAQRIKNLSLREAALNAFGGGKGSVTSLIEEFDYPRLGPGQMWEAVRERVEALGGRVLLNHPVHRIERQGRRITRVMASTPDGVRSFDARAVISSMPLRDLVLQLAPTDASPEAEAAARLKYRAFLVVGLVVDDPQLFEDNWIYIHDPRVKVGRIQNFKNWSPALVPDAATSSVGMEYFCNVGDALWTTPDRELVALASRELAKLGLADRAKIRDGVVYRVPHAYPVYDPTYQEAVATLRRYIEGFANLQTIGRNGLHRYNNQDHAMLTGLLAVRNLLDGESNDLWSVNAEQSYSEEIAKTDRVLRRA